MARFRLLRETKTRAGYRRDDIRNPLTGSDCLIMHGKSAEHVIANARAIGVCGRVIAVEVDADSRPIHVSQQEMN